MLLFLELLYKASPFTVFASVLVPPGCPSFSSISPIRPGLSCHYCVVKKSISHLHMVPRKSTQQDNLSIWGPVSHTIAVQLIVLPPTILAEASSWIHLQFKICNINRSQKLCILHLIVNLLLSVLPILYSILYLALN